MSDWNCSKKTAGRRGVGTKINLKSEKLGGVSQQLILFAPGAVIRRREFLEVQFFNVLTFAQVELQ